MRRKKRTLLMPQADLFQPPSSKPTWHELPSEVREATILMIAQLLRDHRRPSPRHPRPKEVGDE